MRKVSRAAIIVTLSAFTATASFAEDAQPRHRLREACKPDVEKFCASVEHGKGKIRSCLLEHVADLQATCGTAIKERVAKSVQ